MSSEEHLSNRLEEVLVERLQLRDRVGDWHSLDLRTVECHHLAERPVVDSVHRRGPESSREDPVEGARRPAPLDVPENCDAGFEAGTALDLVGHGVSDAAEPGVAELIELR